ncbi:hypothetical protein ABFY60_15645 [Lysinibacillus pakistanensis]|uniref:hypothetical protein n=1 Tax=Lysinibacillus pakistanensis TaxID=759811 RepID=UPI003D2AE2B3
MVTKTIRCNFFYFQEFENGKIDDMFEKQKVILNNKKVTNIKVSNFFLRITFLEKHSEINKHWWVGIIERLETTEEVESSNLVGDKKVYASGEDEGPIKNTGFLYDPQTKTVALHKKIGGVNDVNFGIFIRRLLKQLGVVNNKINEYKLHVLPDLNKLDRLRKAPHIHSLEYSFKLPENYTSIKSEDRAIVGDIFLASKLGGSYMKVKIKADKMNVKETIQKVFRIKELGEDNVNTLKVVAEHNSIEEPLDLLSSRFTDFIDVELKRGKKETVVLIMDTVFKIFKNQQTLIETMYIRGNKED